MINKLTFKAWQFLEQEEGTKLYPYQDSKGVWTIGSGSCYLLDGSRVTSNTPPITDTYAIKLMQNYINIIQVWLYKHCNWQPNQNEFDALCSFLYNIGIGTALNNCPHTKQAIIDGDKEKIISGMRSISNHGLLSKRRDREIDLFLEE